MMGAMASSVRHVTVDCADPYRLATFWAEVLGTPLAGDERPEDQEVLVPAPGVGLLFIRVPEAKTVKNRVHVDVVPSDRTRDEEVERLLALGASVFEDHRRPDGSGWVTVTDLEGNEFCVERSAAERAG